MSKYKKQEHCLKEELEEGERKNLFVRPFLDESSPNTFLQGKIFQFLSSFGKNELELLSKHNLVKIDWSHDWFWFKDDIEASNNSSIFRDTYEFPYKDFIISVVWSHGYYWKNMWAYLLRGYHHVSQYSMYVKYRDDETYVSPKQLTREIACKILDNIKNEMFSKIVEIRKSHEKSLKELKEITNDTGTEQPF